MIVVRGIKAIAGSEALGMGWKSACLKEGSRKGGFSIRKAQPSGQF